MPFPKKGTPAWDRMIAKRIKTQRKNGKHAKTSKTKDNRNATSASTSSSEAVPLKEAKHKFKSKIHRRKIKASHLTATGPQAIGAALASRRNADVAHHFAVGSERTKIEPSSTQGRVNIATSKILLDKAIELLSALK